MDDKSLRDLWDKSQVPTGEKINEDKDGKLHKFLDKVSKYSTQSV